MTPGSTKAFTEDQRGEIKQMMSEAITEYFAEKGAWGTWLIVTIAKVVVSLGVIGGAIYGVVHFVDIHK